MRKVDVSHSLLGVKKSLFLNLLSVAIILVATLTAVSVTVNKSGLKVSKGLTDASPPTPTGYHWEEVWSDDFNGSNFDTLKWRAKVGIRPEDEENGKNPTYYRPENVEVSNGTLKLNVRNESYGGAGYTGGMLSTNGSYDRIRYGYFEARIRYNFTLHVFLANFWMNGTNSWPPEFDQEIFSYYYLSENNQVFQSVYYGPNGERVDTFTPLNFRDWHTYGILWLPDSTVKFYIDDQLTYDSPRVNNNPPNVDMSLILRAGAFVGRNYGGLPDYRTRWPGSAEYDWVRVYRLAPGASLTPTVNFTATPTPPVTTLPTPTTSVPPSGGCISSLTVNDSANRAYWSVKNNLQVGDYQYGDRTYTLTTVPSFYQGSQWIATANDSKAYIGNTVASFSLSGDATVYIANDDRISTAPSWLSNYTLTNDDLINSEYSPIRFSLYSKTFSAGQTVSLGQSGSHGNDFYTVIVKCQGNLPTPTPVLTSTPTPIPTTPAGPECISNLNVYDSANRADWSVQTNLQQGNRQYGDRTYILTTVPVAYRGLNWIKTANDSKAYMGNTVASFRLTRNAIVYIANDDRITNRPSWFSGYTLTSDDLINSEYIPRRFSLYSRYFSSGQTVSLGQSGSHGNDFYTVIVRCQ